MVELELELELELEVRGTPALVADRLLNGTEVEEVADVPLREKIGHRLPLLPLLLVRVQLERDEVVPEEDHERRGGQGSCPGTPGVTGPAAAGLPCGKQFGGGLVKA